MKRKLIFLVTVFALIALLLCSCDRSEDDPIADSGSVETGGVESEMDGIGDTQCSHSFGEWEVSIKATCLSDGELVRICSKCAKKETMTVQKSEEHSPVVDPAVGATCESSGLSEGSHCSVCNKTLTAQEVIDALGHTPVTQAAVTPTCEEDGLGEGSYCETCEKVLVEQAVIPKLGHTVAIDEAVAPTCKKDGLSEGEHCSVCDKVLVEQTAIPKTDEHTIVIDEAVAPTCKKSGLSEGKHCSVCGKVLVEQEVIPKNNDHTVVIDEAVAPTCKKGGLSEGKHRSVCQRVLVQQKDIPKLDHEYEDGVCRLCGAPRESKGLEYVKVDSGYAVVGIGTCKDDTLVIPSYCDGLPVVEISNGALNFAFTDHSPSTLIIPDTVKTVQIYALDFNKFVTIIVGKNAIFEEQSINASGGCEILYSSADSVPSNALSGKTNLAPYIKRKGNESAREIGEDGLVFIKSGAKYYLCDYVGNGGELVLPDSYKGESYVITPSCFYNNAVISSIKLGENVTAIGESAFSYSSLKEIDLSGRVDQLPPFCFAGCKEPKSVVVTDNIVTIESQCFDQSGLVDVTIGRNVKSIGVFAFYSCTDLDTLYFNAENCTDVSSLSLDGFKKLVVGAGVQIIPDNFMSGNKALESVIFEENCSCASIGSYAFNKASSLTEITLPASITNINAAFVDCSKLERININCKSLSTCNKAFYDCGGDGDGIVISVGEEVTSLPSGFLKDCKVKSLVFNGVSDCKTIESGFSSGLILGAVIPASVESFDPLQFDIKTISIASDNPKYKIDRSCLIDITESKLIGVVDSSYVIPEYVTVIGKKAFYNSGVTEIYIPDTVLSMEIGSLYCSTVELVSLPFIGTDRETPKRLLDLFGDDFGLEAQYGWTRVDMYPGTSIHETFYVPPKFDYLQVRDTSISNGLVGLSMLKVIEISDSVKAIGANSFSYCKALTTIYFGGDEEQWLKLKESGWMADVSMNVNVILNAPK